MWKPICKRFKSNRAGPPKANIKELLFGANVILPALESKQRTPFKLYIKEDHESDLVEKAIQLARKRGIVLETVPIARLNKLSDSHPHQGMILSASPFKTTRLTHLPAHVDPLKDYVEKTGKPFPVWLALDHLLDPQNVGAVLRSAHYFGVDGIIMTERASSPLTPTASKASSGAMEVMSIHTTINLSSFLENSAKQGWVIYGTDIHAPEKTVDLGHLKATVTVPHELLYGPTIVVFGNEGQGVREKISSQCHQHLLIPKCKETNVLEHAVDSMNVSVAAGIILYALLHS